MMAGMGSHESAVMLKDEWLTPPHIIESLGSFDLDPCSPADRRPWDTAGRHYGVQDNGLALPWSGRVWLNPPYGRETGKWLARLADHGNGVALVFARTETAVWFNHIWRQADAILFLRGRLHFYHLDGTRAAGNAGAPSALIAYGQDNVEALSSSGIEGHVVYLNHDTCKPAKRLGDEGGVMPTAEAAPLRRTSESYCPECASWVPESHMHEPISRYEWQALTACKSCLLSTRIVSKRAKQSAGRR